MPNPSLSAHLPILPPPPANLGEPGVDPYGENGIWFGEAALFRLAVGGPASEPRGRNDDAAVAAATVRVAQSSAVVTPRSRT